MGHDEIDPGSGQIDEHDSRVAFIEAFRKWGIYPRKLRPLSGGNRCADREAKSKIKKRACNAMANRSTMLRTGRDTAQIA